MHYNRLRNTGRTDLLPKPSAKERFWANVNKDGPHMAHMDTNCWTWTGSTDLKGYGNIRVRHNGTLLQRTHRYIYEITNNVTLTPEIFVRHRCDNRPCVRMDHLLLGTRLENIQDAVSRGRNVRGERVWTHKLTESDVLEIRKSSKGGETGASLARRFGVSDANVCTILKGRSWKHLPI